MFLSFFFPFLTIKSSQDSREFNNKRVDDAGDENEIWNVTKDIINPKKENEWSIKGENDDVITDKVEVANAFNKFFISKIEKLKDNYYYYYYYYLQLKSSY